jgi:hypothetical protein
MGPVGPILSSTTGQRRRIVPRDPTLDRRTDKLIFFALPAKWLDKNLLTQKLLFFLSFIYFFKTKSHLNYRFIIPCLVHERKMHKKMC